MRFLSLPMVLAMTVSVAPAWAQLGRLTGKRIDVQAATANNGCLGVCYTKVGNQESYWVTARATPIAAQNPHKLYEFDYNIGALRNTFNQPVTFDATLSPWGIRDMAWDGGRYLYGGLEPNGTVQQIYVFDLATNTYDLTKTIVVQGTAATLPVVRAIAYNNRNNTLVISDAGDPAYEIDLTGAVRTTVTVSGGALKYGAAYDGLENLIWWHGQSGSTIHSAIGSVGAEWDPVSQAPTGTTFLGDLALRTPAPVRIGGVAGGMESYRRGPNNDLYFVLLAQATSDTIFEMVAPWQTGTSCKGGSGSVPQIGMKNDAPYPGNNLWTVELRGVQGAVTGILWLGTSKTTWNSVPLPFDLTPFGLVGCQINSAWSFFLGTAAVNGGIASMPIGIPPDQSLKDSELFFQWLVVDPTATNPWLLTTSRVGGTKVYGL